jgi:SAM-dependent methyltransferase
MSATHWDDVYRTKNPEEVSWFQAEALLSLDLLTRVAPDRTARIIDVGAGTSRLVDGLLAAGYQELTVLDHSQQALARTADRLGHHAAEVTFVTGDVLTARLGYPPHDLWHDRAAFHFLTDPADRTRYVNQLRRAVRPSGYALIATFAEDGPARCSGLEIVRYSPEELAEEFGPVGTMLEYHREVHTTPAGTPQAFTYGLFQVRP